MTAAFMVTWRTAKYLGSQGCVTLPIGQTSVNFTPAHVASRLPDPSTQPWPMGDVLSDEPLPPEIDATKLKQAIDAAFDPPATPFGSVTWMAFSARSMTGLPSLDFLKVFERMGGYYPGASDMQPQRLVGEHRRPAVNPALAQRLAEYLTIAKSRRCTSAARRS